MSKPLKNANEKDLRPWTPAVVHEIRQGWHGEKPPPLCPQFCHKYGDPVACPNHVPVGEVHVHTEFGLCDDFAFKMPVRSVDGEPVIATLRDVDRIQRILLIDASRTLRRRGAK